ncbi:MAG: ribosome maturation factor RimM [Actinomycetota bacterium]
MGEAPARLVVGRIVKPHGLRGEMVVEVLSDAPERFAPGGRIDAGDPDGARRTLTVRATRNDRGRSLVTFEEVTDRDAAEALRGALLSIAREDAVPLEDGMYYEWQLEGLTVADEDGRTVGTFVRVLEGGGGDLWVVDTGEKEVLVPAVEEFVRRVDLEGGRIVLHVIPGLLE